MKTHRDGRLSTSTRTRGRRRAVSSSWSSRVDVMASSTTARSVVDVALDRRRTRGLASSIDAFARRIGASEGDIVVRARHPATSTER